MKKIGLLVLAIGLTAGMLSSSVGYVKMAADSHDTYSFIDRDAKNMADVKKDNTEKDNIKKADAENGNADDGYTKDSAAENSTLWELLPHPKEDDSILDYLPVPEKPAYAVPVTPQPDDKEDKIREVHK